MARCLERRVASVALLLVAVCGSPPRQSAGIAFTYHPVTCVPPVTLCAPRRTNCVVRNCVPRDRGRFIPKYTDRFSGWRGLRYGKLRERISHPVCRPVSGFVFNVFVLNSVEKRLLGSPKRRFATISRERQSPNQWRS